MAASAHTTGSLKPSCPFSLWASRSFSSSTSSFYSHGSIPRRLDLDSFQKDPRPQKNFFLGSSIQLKQNKLYISANQYAESTPCIDVDSSPLDYPSSRDRPYTNHQSFERRRTFFKNHGSQRKNQFSREANGRVTGSLDRNSVETFPPRHNPSDLVHPMLLKSSRENWVSSLRREDVNVQTARLVKTGVLTDTSCGTCEQGTPVLHEDTNDGFKHQKCESGGGLLIPDISNFVINQPTKSSAPVKLQDLNGSGLEDLESSRVISCSTSSTPGIGTTKRSKSSPSTSKQKPFMKRKENAKVPPINGVSSPGIQVVLQKREELLASSKETGALVEGSHVNGFSTTTLVLVEEKEACEDTTWNYLDRESTTDCLSDVEGQTEGQKNLRSNLCRTYYDKVLVVDNIASAKRVVTMLTTKYRHLVHACDTEVSSIDVMKETPVDHGEITCFSIYSGEADYGHGKSCIWVDVLDGGGKDLLVEFAPFFEDSSIKKVWHNYSFDCHVVENYGIKLSGFHADTMHMARLWNSSRRLDGGYSLEALSCDPKVIPRDKSSNDMIGKVSMKSLFGRRKVKKDGSLGKLITIPSIEEIQREDRKPWICYSALDSISTLRLFESLKCKLSAMPWSVDGKPKGTMVDFYTYYWRPFGELLTQMETEGMLVDRQYLAEVEKVAISEQAAAAEGFRSWASKYCPDARHMNVGSDTQLRQLFFGGIMNSKNSDEFLPEEKQFKVPNVDNVIEEGKKAPLKHRNITLRRISDKVIETELYTATGWPSASREALVALAGKISADYDISEPCALESDDEFEIIEEVPSKNATKSTYGTAYAAFGKGRKGKEACHAIALLCEACSIDSLISNFILPLQGNHVSGKNGRIHCSLNINTETGRLSARRPNLQNQPALEKDRYKIRQAFIASPGNSLVVADYGQLELRLLAHLTGCKSMMDAFKAGGDFHSRTAMNMYPYIREAVEEQKVILEWNPQPGEEKPPVPLLKDAYGSERRKAKMLNFSIAYGKTAHGLARDWKVSEKEAKKTVELWYNERKEVLLWQKERKKEAIQFQHVRTLLGRCRDFPSVANFSSNQRRHIERAAINTPVQGSAADVAMCAMLEIAKNARLKELGWKLLLQIHDEVILEGPKESEEEAKGIVVECMSKPFNGVNFLKVDLAVDAKCAQNWYSAK